MLNKKVWKDGENKVTEYLKSLGYKIIYTNYRCKVAEIDIVAVLSRKMQKRFILSEKLLKFNELQDKMQIKMYNLSIKNRIKNLSDLLVIVEVKSRSNKKFGTGLEAVDENKIRHLRLGAEILMQEKRFAKMQVRFDIASVDSGEISYYENAF